MKPSLKSPHSPGFLRSQCVFVLACLALLLSLLFYSGWLPGWLVFSNDGPLGQQAADYHRPGPGFAGMWQDLNWLGGNGGAVPPSITAGLGVLLGPVLFSKFYAPFALLLVGLGAWFCFREHGFTKWACILGAMAATLNGDFVAAAGWGVAMHPICFAFCYLAMGLVANLNDRPWARTVLAGLAVGMAVIEAADIGAIFSVFVAAWVAVHALVQEGSVVQKIGRGGLRLTLVAGCAVFIAWSSLSSLIGTQVQGVVGMAQDDKTKAMRWAEATQWSLPKREVLGVFVPGFYGFRMDTPYQLPERLQKSLTGGAYWGFIGRDAGWYDFLAGDKQGNPPPGFFRYGMGAGYAGMLVLVCAAWAMVQSLRGNRSCFSSSQRKLIWFWLGVLAVSAAMMFGRHAPFYQFFYDLPYASTIRNPAKFLHVFSWALIVLAGYGLHGLTTLYLERAVASGKGVVAQFQLWWQKEAGFDKKWVVGTLIVLGLALVAWGIYAGNRGKVEAYLGEANRFAGMAPMAAAEAATETFNFTMRQVGWAVVFLAASVGALAVLVSGGFAGRRARLGGILIGGLLVIDLGWQAQPWVIAQNWHARYIEAAANPVLSLLRTKPYEHRVSRFPDRTTALFQIDPQLAQAENMFQSVYGSEWTQHLFPYYNIQSLNVVQMPRRPVDYDAFETAAQFFSQDTLYRAARRLQLSSTDYIVGTAPLVSLLNQAYDPEQKRFKPILLFEFYQDRQGGPILTRTNQTGPYAVIKFNGALPRALLFTNWQVAQYDTNTTAWLDNYRKLFGPENPLIFDSVPTNDLATIELMMRKSFDPAQTVLLAAPLPNPPPTNAAPGTVEYVSYSPKHIVLKAKATAPSVLLLNDKYDANWQVTVDGQPAPLLRCNYLMRGVQLTNPGDHTIEFRFVRPMMPTYITLAAFLVGVGLVGYLVIASRRQPQLPAKV